MPSIIQLVQLGGLIGSVLALPAQPKLNSRALVLYELAERQAADAAASNLTDIDILQLYSTQCHVFMMS